MKFVYDEENNFLQQFEDDKLKEVFGVGYVVTLAYCSNDYDCGWPTITGTIEDMSESQLSVLTLDKCATNHVIDYDTIIAIKTHGRRPEKMDISVLNKQFTIGKNLFPLDTTDNVQDMVNHPPHYKSESGLETIDVIKAFTSELSGIEAVCVANVIKYICRFKHKNGTEDLRKAQWYLNYLLKQTEKEND